MNRPCLIAGYAALTVVLWAGCIDFEGLWYDPEAIDEYTAWQDEDSIVPVEHVEWITLESPAVGDEEEASTLHGVWLHQCLSAVETSCLPSSFPWRQRQTILYFHANSDNIDAYWDRLEIFFRMGYTIFAIDYRGYGRSTGTPSEDGLHRDAEVSLDHVVRRKAVERDPDVDLDEPPSPNALDIVYYGFSLGTIAAVHAAVGRPGASVLLEAANAGTQAFVDDGLGIGIDHSVVMDTSFDTLDKISFVLSPKLLLHGTDDDFVRYEFAEQLFANARDPKELYTVEGGEHGNVPCPTVQDDQPCTADDAYKDAIGDFLDEYVGGPE